MAEEETEERRGHLPRPRSVGRTSDGSRAKPDEELGLSGLNILTGEVDEEFLPQLKGIKATKVYNEMSDNDPVVGAVLHAIDMMLRGVEWDVTAADDSEGAEEGAEFVRECMDDMEHTWDEFISEVLTMLPHGWSYFESVYKPRKGEHVEDWEPSHAPGMHEPAPTRFSSKHDDGKIGWRKFALRSQNTRERWEVDDKGNVHGMWQMSPPDYQRRYIPMAKALLFRTTSRKNNPEGRSVLRNAYRPWFFKKRLEEIEGIGIERDLAGLPVAWIPAQYLTEEADEDEKAIAQLFEDAVKNVRRDAQEGLVLPREFDENNNSLYDFVLLSTGGTRTFNTDAIIQRYDQRIAMTVLADLILLGHEAVGSYALSTSKEGMLRASLTAWLDLVAEVLNRFELPRLWRINNLPQETMPEFTHGEVDSPTPAELGAFITQLAGVGMPFFPNQELENHLLEVAKLPTRTEDEWKAMYEIQQAQQEAAQPMVDEEEEETFEPTQDPAGGGGTIPSNGNPSTSDENRRKTLRRVL